MAVTIDLGDVDKPDNIHPKDKLDVGKRLSLVAQRVAYGKDVVDSGPVFEKMTIEGSKAHLTFRHGEVRLIILRAASQPILIPAFAIAGWPDKKICMGVSSHGLNLAAWWCGTTRSPRLRWCGTVCVGG